MKNLFCCICLLSFFQLSSQDTFSIVAADSATGEVGAAGATCIDGAAQIGGVQIISQIIPGRGGINSQAWICIPNINLSNGIEQMGIGLSPDELVTWLTQNDACSSQGFNPNFRQYGIVDFDDDMNVRTATYTGTQADDYKGGVTGINYAIQGNILLGPEIIQGLEDGFNNTEGSLAAKLMGAMQGANVPGADMRCLGRGTSSTTAFLKVYKPEDNVNNPYLNLNILEMPFGEEPIDSLQSMFDTWVQTTSVLDEGNKQGLSLFPNPVIDVLNLKFEQDVDDIEYKIFDNSGKMYFQGSLRTTKESIDLSQLDSGVYFLSVSKNGETIARTKFLKY